MTNKFKILLQTDKNPDRYTHCWVCSKKITSGNHYIIYGSGKYHLSCFNTYGKKLSKKWESFKKNMDNNIIQLEPYNKEMICESLGEK